MTGQGDPADEHPSHLLTPGTSSEVLAFLNLLTPSEMKVLNRGSI